MYVHCQFPGVPRAERHAVAEMVLDGVMSYKNVCALVLLFPSAGTQVPTQLEDFPEEVGREIRVEALLGFPPAMGYPPPDSALVVKTAYG